VTAATIKAMAPSAMTIPIPPQSNQTKSPTPTALLFDLIQTPKFAMTFDIHIGPTISL
jgi:hypothetical protein